MSVVHEHLLAIWEVNSVNLPGLEGPPTGGAFLLGLHCLLQAVLTEDMPCRIGKEDLVGRGG